MENEEGAGSMIFVDDSGWGSILGGVAIGLYNEETQKFVSKIIPVRYFQGTLFKTGKYKEQALKIFLSYWIDMEESDGIVVCRGVCLNSIYNFLESKGQRVYREEIKDPLQGMLEAAFAKHLKRCGVPQRTDGAHCLSFDDQLKWIYEDPRRVKYVKTGWKSWKQKYSQNLV